MPTPPEQFLSAMRHTMSTHEWNADLSDHIIMLLNQAGAPLIEIPADHRVAISLDEYYESDGDYDLEQERRSLQSGELTAYVVRLEKQCECGNWSVIESLSGVVVETGNADNTYDDLDHIPDTYLRSVAAELITEAEQS